MPNPTADLELTAGDSFKWDFRFRDASGTYEDLEGKVFVLTLQWGEFWKQYSTEDVSPKLTVPLVDGGYTRVRIHEVSTETDNWPRERIAYALKEVVSADDRWTYVEGDLVVTQKVDENAGP